MSERPGSLAMARVVPAAEATAWRDGYRCLDQARKVAERARHDAATGFAAERRRGRQEGTAAGAAEAVRLLDEAEHLIGASLAGLEREIVLLAVDLAERVLGGFEDREIVVRAAERALEDLRAEEDAVLYAAPQHLKTLGERMAVLAAGRSGRIALEADPSAGARDGSLMTGRGIVKLDMAAQLDALRAGILAWYSDQGAP